MYNCYLMMKSNCEKASMMTPRAVEMAPCRTGAIICSSANAARTSLLPRLPTKL